MDPKEIGSWDRAVTTGDAAWLTRGVRMAYVESTLVVFSMYVAVFSSSGRLKQGGRAEPRITGGQALAIFHAFL